MTTKEASKKFLLSVKDIANLCKEGLIKGAEKGNRMWTIPDKTSIILKKNEIRKILLDILQFKNNEYFVSSCEYNERLPIVVKYLQGQGFVGECEEKDKKEIYKKLQLTEEGFAMLIGGSNKNNNAYYLIKNVNINNNFCLIKIG